LARVRLVLVRPGTTANVGAVARVVRNAGLSGLDLVGAGDWRTVDCWRTAWGAQDVLESARVFPDLASAIGEATLAAALSGRRDSGSPVLDVRELAAEVASLGPEEKVALVFGPEAIGLSGDEIALCGRRVRIPSHPDQPSLNLSHAAMVVAYEVFRAGRKTAPFAKRATHDEKQALLLLLRQGLLAIEALPTANTDGYFREWQAMIARADLTPTEVRLLEHMSRKMEKAGRKGRT
jgi:tRNA/rRNA methyltransferase